jgi:hypothetical protein
MCNFLIKPFLQLFFLIAFVHGGGVAFNINNESFHEDRFYSMVPKTEWDRSSYEQKGTILKEFINRLVVLNKAEAEGFLEQPYVAVRLRNREKQLLINAAYDFLVAAPLVGESDFLFTRENLQREIKVKHLLVGYKGCRLPLVLNKSKEEAEGLANELYSRLVGGDSFVDLALQLSDDPSVNKNNGDLGWLSWGQTIPVFQKAAFSLEVGGVSPPVLTDFGFHLIYLEEEKKSHFFYMDSLGYLSRCRELSINGIPLPVKRAAAEAYDEAVLAGAGVVFNVPSILKIVQKMNKETEKNAVLSGGKKNTLSLLKEMEDIGVVCVYKGYGYGVRWFASHLGGLPSSRLPSLNSMEEVLSVFRTTILQKDALGYSDSLLSRYDYILGPKLHDHKKNIVYDAYIKHFINSLEKPSKETVENYYEKNKDEEYVENNLVEVRELKVTSRVLVDSLFLLLGSGMNFSVLAEKYSLTNPLGGGLISPFTEKRYGPMGVVAFTLKEGEHSVPIENLDGTWSIIYLVQKIEKQFIPIDRLYSKIESIVIKNSQSKFKENLLESLFVENNVTINPAFYVFGR